MFILFILFFFSTSKASLTLLSPEEFQGEYLAVVFKWIGNTSQDFIINETIYIADPIDACSNLNNKNINGGVLLTVNGKCFPGDKARFAQDVGASSILVVGESRNYIWAGLRNYDGAGVYIRVIEVGVYNNYEPFISYMSNNPDGVLYGTIIPDPNPLAPETLWSPYSVIFGILNLACLIIASKKLYLFLMLNGPVIILPHIVLTFHILACIFRLVEMCEPGSTARGCLPWRAQSLFYTYSWPYTFSATLIIAFYWESSLRRISKSLQNSNQKMIKRLKIPAICVCVALILINNIFSFLNMAFLLDSNVDTEIYGIICTIISFFVGIYFVFTGLRTSKLLKDTISDFGKSEMAKRLSFLISFSGMGLFIFVLGAIVSTFTLNSTSTQVYLLGGSILLIGLGFTTLGQVLSFVPSENKPTSSEHKSADIQVSIHSNNEKYLNIAS